MRDALAAVKNELLFCKTLTATETPTTGVDLQGFNSATVVCAVGTITNVANSPQPSWTLTLQESDDDSTYTSVASADANVTYGNNDGAIASGVFATIDAAAEDDAIYTCSYVGDARYIRVVATAANTPGATPIFVGVIKGALQQPQDDE